MVMEPSPSRSYLAKVARAAGMIGAGARGGGCAACMPGMLAKGLCCGMLCWCMSCEPNGVGCCCMPYGLCGCCMP
jgi:hypothetical protein